MIVGGQTRACFNYHRLSSTIIDYHAPFDRGFIGMKSFTGKFQTAKHSNWPSLATFMLACTVSIATCTDSHQSPRIENSLDLYFEYANDNLHLPINLLGVIIKGLYM